MLVREAMTTPAVSVRRDDSVRQAAQVLLEHRIASAPVLDDAGRLVGIVSEADLLRGRTGPDPRAHLLPVQKGRLDAPPERVADAMSSVVLTVRPDEDVDQAARKLLDSGIKMLPVVDRDRVVGVVARRDLLRSFARSDQDVARDVRQLLGDLGQPGLQVTVRDGVVTMLGALSPRQQRIAAVLTRTVPGVVRVVTTTGPAGLGDRQQR